MGGKTLSPGKWKLFDNKPPHGEDLGGALDALRLEPMSPAGERALAKVEDCLRQIQIGMIEHMPSVYVMRALRDLDPDWDTRGSLDWAIDFYRNPLCERLLALRHSPTWFIASKGK
jgi:hypothetical protein